MRRLRLPRHPFQHRMWMTGWAHGLSTALLPLAGWMLWRHVSMDEAWKALAWALLALCVYKLLTLSGSIGMHRLFSHNAWRASRFWQAVLAFSGTLLLIGSPIQWCVAHAAHHKFADTFLDPHNVRGWRSAFLSNYARSIYSFRHARHLIRDPMHLWLHRWAMLWVALFVAALACVGWLFGVPGHAVMFGFVVPLCFGLWLGGLHNVIAHGPARGPRAPVNVRLLCLGWGEWLHANHHANPKAWDFSTGWREPDLGARVIALIKS